MRVWFVLFLVTALLITAMPMETGFATPRGKVPKLIVTPSNKYCPVDGVKLTGATSYFVDYGGKTLGFCCSECKRKFISNPARYSGNIR